MGFTVGHPRRAETPFEFGLETEAVEAAIAEVEVWRLDGSLSDRHADELIALIQDVDMDAIFSVLYDSKR